MGRLQAGGVVPAGSPSSPRVERCPASYPPSMVRTSAATTIPARVTNPPPGRCTSTPPCPSRAGTALLSSSVR